MSGRIGSVVASSNKSGLFMRKWLSPRNTQTSLRQSHRLLFSQFASLWNSLSSATHIAFSNAAQTWNWQKFDGTTYHPSAYQLFLFLSFNSVPENKAGISSPSNYSLLSDSDASIICSSPAINLKYESGWTKDNANEFLKCYISKLYLSSSLLSNIQYNFCHSITSNLIDTDLSAYSQAIWGRLPKSGESFYVRTVKCNKLTGLISSFQDEQNIVP